MTVRARLTLLNVLVFTVVMTVLGVGVRQHVKQNLEAGVDRVLERRPRNRRERPPRMNKENVEEGRAKWKAQNDPEAFAFPLFNPNAINIYSDRPAGDPAAIKHVLETGKPYFSTVGDRRYYTNAVPEDRVDKEIGPLIFQGSESLEATNIAVAQFTRSLLTMIPIAMFMAAVGGLFLTNRALRPIKEATEAAGRISASDLSKRLPVTGKDEFARLAQTLNRMLERLELDFVRQQQFIADASHELRTPLTVIKANTSLALADPELTIDERETLTEIDGAADRTTRIVQDLLLLARSDAGQLNLEKEPIALGPLFEELAREAPKLRENTADVVVQLAEPITIEADPHHLRRLLTNLVDNALRHTPSVGQVTLSAIDKGGHVVLSVEDTGEGIPLEHLPQIGERFYRADASRARTMGGTGLGLAIARSIVESHGGNLHIHSVLGEGTRVDIDLPR
ncbi:MAG: HAMP domain-containing sensor histidine kinase [Armatimonas sp.]